MAHPSVDADRYKPICGDIHNPADTHLPEIATPNPTTPRDSEPGAADRGDSAIQRGRLEP